jgi:hypothetical protein
LVPYIDTGYVAMDHFQSRIVGTHAPRQFLALFAIQIPARQPVKNRESTLRHILHSCLD